MLEGKIKNFMNETLSQVGDKHYPLVDSNSGAHQFFGFLKALESLNLLDEDDVHNYASMFESRL